MGKTLFLGHADTGMRGGPAIFTSIYKAWSGDKYMIFEKSYKTMIKRLLTYILKNKVDKIIMENEYFSDVFIALLIKIFNRKIMIYGPAYHIPPFAIAIVLFQLFHRILFNISYNPGPCG